MLDSEKIHKFDYLSQPEVKDIWYKPENIQFRPLHNALNCINVFKCPSPIYQPYDGNNTPAMHITLSIINEFDVSQGMKILTRALDPRYGGSDDWVCKMIHTDTSPYFKVWVDTGVGSKSKTLEELVMESNIIARNIMDVLDDDKLIDMFESSWVKVSSHDYGHINREEFEAVVKLQNRNYKLRHLGI